MVFAGGGIVPYRVGQFLVCVHSKCQVLPLNVLGSW